MMNLQVITSFLLLSVAAAQESQLKGAMEGLLSRLAQNSSESLTPTLSIDLWTLLRLAAQTELRQHNEKTKVDRIGARAAAKSFPSSLLDLTFLGDKNYFFSKKQMMTWIDANSFCRLYGMELVSIETKEEDELITKHLASIGFGGTSIVYLSGNKIGRSTYIWLNGQHLIYENWRANDPANFATEHCMAHYTGRWIDCHCSSEPSYFICEDQS